jgi:uncharacterized protein YjbI with pentapeptide repeats
VKHHLADNLAGASLFDVVGSVSAESAPANAPNFEGADLSHTRIMARLRGANMRGANLADARLGTQRNQFTTPKQTDLSDAILVNANLTRADLTEINLRFADLTNANLSEADLTRADLSRANLTGANLSSANLADVDLDGAVLKGVRGLEPCEDGTKRAMRMGICFASSHRCSQRKIWRRRQHRASVLLRLRRYGLTAKSTCGDAKTSQANRCFARERQFGKGDCS